MSLAAGGHRRPSAVARTAGAPIALGEHFHTSFEVAPWLEPRALDVLQPDIGRTGISNALQQRLMALAAGIDVTPHMGSGLDIFQAATLQFAAICNDGPLTELQGGLELAARRCGRQRLALCRWRVFACPTGPASVSRSMPTGSGHCAHRERRVGRSRKTAHRTLQRHPYRARG
ncbi:MAG: hypothetical protein H6852_17775 [Geminicoccaceae bacterium]|nr:hypothetical protein [Geminicoccaceae bacterium]